jgi:hypothetical protein
MIMAFNWVSYFNSYRVPFLERGPNTSRDNVVVHCPFCGLRDEGMHMSVNLSGKGWRCFRDHSHRGKNPARLVAALSSLPIDRANALVGNAVFIPDDFMGRVKSMLEPDVPVQDRAHSLVLPEDFRAFGAHVPSARPYERYLRDRGFAPAQIDRFTDRYDMRYCTRGPFRNRIIFPVWFEQHLVSWTGRSIDPNSALRYRALSRDPERAREEGFEPSQGAISHYILWYDRLREADADTLVLNEGPFDALKVNVLGRRHGVAATCFFTSAPTQQQLGILQDLMSRFRRKVVMLDSKGTLATGIQITDALSMFGVESYILPQSLKDPGEFDASSFAKFLLAMRI